MSFEGYYQVLCKNGHYDCGNCYSYEPIGNFCSICREKIIWWNLVDITNGSWDDEGKRIDGYIDLKIKKQKKCDKCNSIIETIYEIPEKGGHKND